MGWSMTTQPPLRAARITSRNFPSGHFIMDLKRTALYDTHDALGAIIPQDTLLWT